ncbi:MAG TPA: Zn-dependent protease, partial [Xanthobacteraceae bacterium]|nr:Zn-dependent protease [Xanthobacteraceae bacterium]
MVTNSGPMGILRLRFARAAVAAAAFASAALVLAACTGTPPSLAPQVSLSGPAKSVDEDMSPAALREHQRILAAYGGVYNDPRLQGMVEQTVDHLVASSERPDLHYKVT